MAEFLSTRRTSAEIEQIIGKAEKYLVLVAPFMKLPPALLEMVKETPKRGIRTIVIYGKETDSNLESQLKKIPKLELYFIKNLHAKCYLNEVSIVISSMNLYDYSEVNNLEMGVLIRKNKDSELYSSVNDELHRWLKTNVKAAPDQFIDVFSSSDSDASENITSLPLLAQKEKKILDLALVKVAPEKGFCIRCGIRIPGDHSKPYCRTCFYDWKINEDEDPDFLEKRCHFCGKDAQTTIEYPLCVPCAKKVAEQTVK